MTRKSARKQFGERVRQLRKERGWSQEEFSARSGLHRTYVGSIERGERNVSLDNIVRIAAALSIRCSDLLIGVS